MIHRLKVLIASFAACVAVHGQYTPTTLTPTFHPTNYRLLGPSTNLFAANSNLIMEVVSPAISNEFTSRAVLAITTNGSTLDSGATIDFSLGTNFVVSKRGYRFEVDRSATNFLFPTTTTYYIRPSGNDANNGLTWATAKAGIGTTLDAFTAAGPPAGGLTLILEGGTNYSANNSFNTKYAGYPLVIVATNGYAYIPSGRAGSEFTLLTNAVYKRASHAPNGVFTWRFRGTEGAPYSFVTNTTSWANEYTLGSTLAAGEYSVYSGACYLRMPDDSNPGADTLTRSTSSTNLYSLNLLEYNVYLQGIRMVGHGGGIYWRSILTNGSRLAAYDVEVAGTTSTTKDAWTLIPDDGFTFLEKCRADYAAKDGFNYAHYVPTGNGGYAIEVDCGAAWNGFEVHNNSTTTHQYIRSLRVNGLYLQSAGRQVHDIDHSSSVLVGTVAGLPQLTTAGGDVAYYTGQSSGTDTSRMWLIDCASAGVAGASGFDYVSEANSTLYLIGTTGSGRGDRVYRGLKASVVRNMR